MRETGGWETVIYQEMAILLSVCRLTELILAIVCNSLQDGSEAIICVKETSGAMLKIDHYTMVGYDPPKKSTPVSRYLSLRLLYCCTK